ncbi:ArnT family glycosyltransferase [Luteibacter sahnii]|uniref:ArnT family glycosyltransferase n=1 Tax=Luteibacter sahnii TaxID=3021977 RepID=UPI002A6AA7FA|nr:glycosyltransferase family 39 protein [Luteibacter sp. PPL193]MDY1548895.1 glycosyltransferase family 39 protein [Luteibacter sp. PPL193]
MSISAYTRSEHLRALWPWLPLWTVMALLAIFSHGPMPMFSTRTLAVAWEMWAHGHWLVPYINGEPYSEKVPLLFWMIHAGWAAFGVNDVWPRVLEVIFGGVQLVLASVLASRLFPARPWVAKATPWLLMALSYSFLFGLQIMYEVLLVVWVLAALLCLVPSATRSQPRWWLFALVVGAGLLTKGPVMVVHVLFPLLFGPLWNDWARQNKARWYGFGLLALLGGFAILLAWAIPAGEAGGEAYRQRLFFTQTAGRVVSKHTQGLQNHARPAWFYLLYLPVIVFPLSGWLRGIVALPTALLRKPWRPGTGAAVGVAAVALVVLLLSATVASTPAWVGKVLAVLVFVPLFVALMRQPLETGLRFLVAWLLPALLTFSLIGGKQLYYLLPELAGVILLVAACVADLRERHKTLATHYALGTWPLSVGAFLLAVALFAMPSVVPTRFPDNIWLTGMAPYARFFAVVFVVLGALLLLRGRGEMRRLAFAGLVGTVALNALFTMGLWYRYDLAPASAFLGQADAAGQPIGNLGTEYNGQYHFAGRLMHPIARINMLPGMTAAPDDDDDDAIHDGDSLHDFATHHPNGLIVSYERHPPAEAFRFARLIQPSRTGWLMIWDAPTLDALKSGRVPDEPAQPTLLFPQEYWRGRTGLR